MTPYIIRLLLIASALYFIFPMIPGIQFHGNFLHALAVGVLFAFLGWIIESLAIAITAILTIGTFGSALIILLPAWLLGFWLLPALVLISVAGILPSILSFTGWEPAIWGGLIMLLIGLATSGHIHDHIRRTPSIATE